MVRMQFCRPRRPRPARRTHLAVEAGQVVCPERGITDVETCFACRRYSGLVTSGEQLVCGGGNAPDIELSAFAGFGHQEV